MGCAAERECREKMYANFKYGGDKCEPDRQRQATCTQCCYKTNCFTSQGYVEWGLLTTSSTKLDL